MYKGKITKSANLIPTTASLHSYATRFRNVATFTVLKTAQYPLAKLARV